MGLPKASKSVGVKKMEPVRKSVRTRCPRIGANEVIVYEVDSETGCRVIRSLKTLSGKITDIPTRPSKKQNRGVFIPFPKNKTERKSPVRKTAAAKKRSAPVTTNSKVVKMAGRRYKNPNTNIVGFLEPSDIPENISLARPKVIVPVLRFHGNPLPATQLKVRGCFLTYQKLDDSLSGPSNNTASVLRRSVRKLPVRASSMGPPRLDSVGTGSAVHFKRPAEPVASKNNDKTFTMASSSDVVLPVVRDLRLNRSTCKAPVSAISSRRPASSASMITRKAAQTTIAKKKTSVSQSVAEVMAAPLQQPETAQKNAQFLYRHPGDPEGELQMILKKGTRDVKIRELPVVGALAEDDRATVDQSFVANYVSADQLYNPQNKPSEKQDPVRYCKLLKCSAEEAGYLTIKPGYRKGGGLNSKNTRLTLYVSRGVAKVFMNEENPREFLPLGERGVVAIQPGRWYDVESVRYPNQEPLEMFFMRTRVLDVTQSKTPCAVPVSAD